ncbi:MAG TPA: ABC transporter permease subunit [Micromonosporaceae bacterium]
MTTMLEPAQAARPTPTGSGPVRLIKAELLKIWTTNSWWVFGLITLVTTGIGLLITISQAHDEVSFAESQQSQPPPDFGGPKGPDGEPMGGPSQEEIDRMREQYFASIDIGRILVRSAGNIFTSGQFFGLLFMVILGALIVTNEFFHQTATTTFLATPHRTKVIVSKLAAAMLIAFGFWAVTTAVNLGVGNAFFSFGDYSLPLSDWPVLRAMLMNLLAYVIWAVLGVGLGVLIRSQLGATLTGAAFYLLSFPVAFLFFGLVRQYLIQQDWVWNLMVGVPGVASQVMITTEPLQFGPTQTSPEWWVGALVLVGYGLVASLIGTLITRIRDIS